MSRQMDGVHKRARGLLLLVSLIIAICVATAKAQNAKMSGSKLIFVNSIPSSVSGHLRETEAFLPQVGRVIVHDLDDAGIKKLIGRLGRRERPLLVYMWYTACEQCRSRLRDVQRIYDEDQTRGLDVVVVSINPIDTKESLSKYLSEHKVTVPAYLLGELDDELAEDIFKREWEVTVPSMFFYDPKGHLIFSETEPSAISYSSLKIHADKLLALSHR